MCRRWITRSSYHLHCVIIDKKSEELITQEIGIVLWARDERVQNYGEVNFTIVFFIEWKAPRN